MRVPATRAVFTPEHEGPLFSTPSKKGIEAIDGGPLDWPAPRFLQSFAAHLKFASGNDRP